MKLSPPVPRPRHHGQPIRVPKLARQEPAPAVSVVTLPLSPDLAAVVAAQQLSTFQVELLQASLDSLPPVVAGQHTDASAPESASFEHYLAMEEILGSSGVFTSMFDGRPCSAASYGTIFGFQAFDAAFKLIGVDRFTRADWVRLVAYHRHNWYLSPVLGLLASAIARKVSLPDPLNKDEVTAQFYAGHE